MNKKYKNLLLLIIGIIIALTAIFFMIYIGKYIINQIPETYTIQDIYNWCCNNINSTISPTGDNCTIVINNIYGGKC